MGTFALPVKYNYLRFYKVSFKEKLQAGTILNQGVLKLARILGFIII
jgi:hypothetical protein